MRPPPLGRYPDPTRLWRSRAAVEPVRRAALDWARRERDRRAATPRQVMEHVHLGYGHVDFFHSLFPPILRALPRGFTAVEMGAGMAWHAAMLLAHGAGRVVATEPHWGAKTPLGPHNATALRRLAERDPALASALDLSDPNPEMVGLPRGLQLAHGAADRLPVRDGCADLVYSVNCLEHIVPLAASMGEAARALRIGGRFFATSEPLYYAPFGHHLGDVFPLPWGHLLWEAEELVELALSEAGPGREWEPGVPLAAEHLRAILLRELNYLSPAALRAAFGGPWRVRGWVDWIEPEWEQRARAWGLGAALAVPREWLVLRGVTVHVERRPRPEGLRLAVRLPATVRRLWRR
ncbi:MAG: methyltransferase domain-containing protein [Candidatus Sumerlaeia bacterium]|nr:methyltransferase domain-containing protein [Candidatus Sumerlaeia bacterium]